MTVPTIAATNALTDLVDATRVLIEKAQGLGVQPATDTLVGMSRTFDGARTRLVEDGSDYLDAAWAFVDAGRKHVAEWTVRLTRVEAQLCTTRV